MSIHYVKVLISPSFSLDSDILSNLLDGPVLCPQANTFTTSQPGRRKDCKLKLYTKNAHDLRKVSS